MDYLTETMPLGELNPTMADDAAKRLNLKPSEVQFVRKGLVVEAKGTDDDERSSKELITTESKDRDSEVLTVKGAVLDYYQTNPLVLWAHKYDEPPIGRNAWIKRDKDSKGLLAKTIYATTEFAEQIWLLVKGGFLPGRSVGFIPIAAHTPEAAEVKLRPEWKDVQRIYDKWELLEYSVVPVPSNRQALLQSVGKSLSPALKEELGLKDEPEAKPEPPKRERIVIPMGAAPKIIIPKDIRVYHDPQQLKMQITRMVKDEINRKRGKM